MENDGIYRALRTLQVDAGIDAESWQNPTDISSGTCSSDDELRLKRVLTTCRPSPAKSPAPGPPTAGYLGDLDGSSTSSTTGPWSCWTDCRSWSGGSELGSGPAHGYMSTRCGGALHRCPYWRFVGWLAANPSTNVDNTISWRSFYPVGKLQRNIVSHRGH